MFKFETYAQPPNPDVCALQGSYRDPAKQKDLSAQDGDGKIVPSELEQALQNMGLQPTEVQRLLYCCSTATQ